MKPRARRITVAAAVIGAGVVGVLVVLHWSTVRNHVGAWWFQFTRKTLTIEPVPGDGPLIVGRKGPSSARLLCSYLANYSGLPVIFAAEDHSVIPARMYLRDTPDLLADAAQYILESNGYLVLEQRLPRSAYVVIPDMKPGARQEPDRLRGWGQ